MHPAFARVDHRPWPLPERAWSWRQAWEDLLFAHWPLPVERVRELVPEPLEVDCHEGQTYVALVPFRMTGVMRRPLPDLPGVSAFPEVNVRVYVRYRGVPGVFFLSLDAPNPLAVWAARSLFHLPYHRARIDFEERVGRVHYAATRDADGLELCMDYAPVGNAYEARAGSLEHWLTERYCLYARSGAGALYRCEVHHVPWPLQRAEARIERATLLTVHGVDTSAPPLLHFSKGVRVVMWSPERVG